MRTINYIILHCTAGPQNQKTSVIQAYWKSKGYKKPGYHHLISADGTVEDLQPIELPSNGVAGFNSNSINICYKGGVDANGKIVDNRTDAQKAAMRSLVIKYHAMFPKAIIQGHRDFSPDKNRDGIIQPGEWMKACPCFSVKAWLTEEGILDTPAPTVPKKVVDTANNSGLNLRTGPGTDFEIIETLPENTVCQVIGAQGEWSNVAVAVDDDENLTGWVKTQYLK